MPTLLDLAGVDCDVNLDGVSFRELVLNETPLPERPLFWASMSNGGQRSEAVRQNQWKLVVQHPKATPGSYENPRTELYHLAKDPGETNNLAQQHPEKVESMRTQLQTWLAETNATATKQPGGW